MLRQGGTAENEAGRAAVQGQVRHFLFTSAQDNGTGTDTGGFPRESDDDIAGNFIKNILLSVDDMTFQRTEQVKDGDGGYMGIHDGIHIALGHGAGCDHAEKTSVLLNDRKGGYAVILAVEHVPRMGDGNALTDHRGVS